MTTILRRIFPLKFNCPKCDHDQYDRNGHSRDGTLEYRTCKSATCAYRFAVPALAVEVLTPGHAASHLMPG